MEKVTIGIVNFNGQDTLPETLNSIQSLDYCTPDVVLVDNDSSDGSREWAQKHYPNVRCIRLYTNRGPAAARNIILREAKTDYVLMIDNDIVLEPLSLTRLVEVMRRLPSAGVCHPEIHDTVYPDARHYNGGYIHYLCALVPREDQQSNRPSYEILDVVSGAALLVRRKVVLEIGGFDEDYFFNWEDGDCISRITLAGYSCVNVPHAIAHHHGNASRVPRVFYQTRNRWFFILKLYSYRTLVLAAPMLLIFELSQALFLTMKGEGKNYWKGNLAVLHQLPSILRKRRAFHKLKVMRDRDWLRGGYLYVPDELVKGKILRAVQKMYCNIFDLYWRIIQPFC